MKTLSWIVAVGLTLPLWLTWSIPAQAAPDECNASTRFLSQTPPAFAQLGMSAAWRLASGKGVRVAVVDSGVNAGNPHLSGVVDAGTSLVGGSAQSDSYGTGTAIASVIAAKLVKGSGLTGVAPGARIVPVKVFESTESGKITPDPTRTAAGIRWAAGQPGVRIIVVAQASETASSALSSAVADATRGGALVVAAVGPATSNNTEATTYPAGYRDALAVTAVDSSGAITSASLRGDYVELAAPGSQVLAAHGDGDCLLASDKASTEYAAGYAAGVAALVASAHPDEKPADWQYRLLATALRPSPDVRNKQSGWGIIAPYDAINFVNDGTLPGPTNPRYPAPPPKTSQNTTVLAAPNDTGIPATVVVTAVAGAAVALVAAGLMIGRLRNPTPADRSSRRG